jgi:hypothetical protein
MENHQNDLGSGSDTPDDPQKTTRSKLATILSLFVRGHNLNRFEAENHHDHCLHSTVSSLEDRGIRIARQWERVPCVGGKLTVRCKRYWLDTAMDNRAAAQQLLSMIGRTT